MRSKLFGVLFPTSVPIVGGEEISETAANLTLIPTTFSNSAGCARVHRYRTTTDLLDVHKSLMQDQMLLLCCRCTVIHISINHYPNISPPLVLNNRTYGLSCLPLCPQQMRRPAHSSSRSHMMKQPEPLISL